MVRRNCEKDNENLSILVRKANWFKKASRTVLFTFNYAVDDEFYERCVVFESDTAATIIDRIRSMHTLAICSQIVLRKELEVAFEECLAEGPSYDEAYFLINFGNYTQVSLDILSLLDDDDEDENE